MNKFTTHGMKASQTKQTKWLSGRTDKGTYQAVKMLCIERQITIQDLLNRLVKTELAKPPSKAAKASVPSGRGSG